MNYYNEHDPFAAAWLRELMNDGHIPLGHVDERDIRDVLPGDLDGYTQCHWFAGIGGWSHALRLAGWPDDRPVWTGSCPCQPFSAAGRNLGTADDRHLWPAWFRLIRECRPPVIFGEQVASAAVVGKNVQEVRGRKGFDGISFSQQGRPARNVPGLRERDDTRDQTLADAEKESLHGATASDAQGFRANERRASTGADEKPPVRDRLARYSVTDRQRNMRGDGATVRLDDTESVERAVDRSNGAGGGIHKAQYPSGAVCPKYDGERLGRGFDSDDCGCDSGETVMQRVERLIIGDRFEAPRELEEPWLDIVRADLEREGYALGAAVLGAHSVSAPHIRQRLWFVARHMADAAEPRRGAQPIGAAGADGRQAAEPRRLRDAGQLAEHGREGRRQIGADAGGRGGRGEAQGLDERSVHGCDVELGHANDTRLEGRSLSECRRAGERSPWAPSDLVWLPCRDGKARPAPQATQCRFQSVADGLWPSMVDSGSPYLNPLAQGQTNRVGMLRGAGNAIVPQVAAEIIRAFCDIT